MYTNFIAIKSTLTVEYPDVNLMLVLITLRFQLFKMRHTSRMLTKVWDGQ